MITKFHYGAMNKLLTASARSWWLGVDADRFMFCFDDCLKGGFGKVWRPHKNESKWFHNRMSLVREWFYGQPTARDVCFLLASGESYFASDEIGDLRKELHLDDPFRAGDRLQADRPPPVLVFCRVGQ